MTSFVDPLIKDYIQNNSLEKRRMVSKRLLSTHPSCVPIIVGRAELHTTPMITRNKIMCPSDVTFLYFITEVRKHIPALRPGDGLYLFVSNGNMPKLSTLMSELYNKYKNDDGFLYVTFSCENTFG